MGSQNNDILRLIEINEVEELKDFYYNYKDTLPQIYSFLKTAIKWMTTYLDNPGIRIYSVEGDWRNDGTFIALLQFSCYDIILHSLEESYNKLRKALTLTKEINWSLNSVLFYAIHENLVPMIHDVLQNLEVPIELERPNYLWQIMENKALELQETYENSNFYLDVIDPNSAGAINAVWPPQYEGSTQYIETYIRRNGGYGIYEKSTGKLVAWILHNILGQLGVLQTKEGYFKRGFASALTQKLANEIAKNGNHPIGTVREENVPSASLFTKLGFSRKFKSIYIRTKKTQ